MALRDGQGSGVYLWEGSQTQHSLRFSATQSNFALHMSFRNIILQENITKLNPSFASL
jgi:hypothetical protein